MTTNTSTSSAIHTFSENTKSVFSLTLKGLVLIILSTFLSHYNESRSFLLNSFLFGLNLLICLILGFAFYNNYKETNNLYKKVPTIFSNSDYKGLRNNILLSYGLCFMLAGLFFYNLYSALF